MSDVVSTFSCPTPIATKDRVLLGHGSGGRLSNELVRDVFLPAFDSAVLARLDDQATLSVERGRLAFTTDSFVVKPLFFPGGDIGSLAIHGTINDVAMGGGAPRWLSVAFIIEEGLEMATLKRIVASAARAASDAGVEIVAGDTKVVERGAADGVYINTTGIGVVAPGLELGADRAQPDDVVLVSGTLGDHGIAVMASREGLEFETSIQSDSAALHGLVAQMLETGAALRCLRDPTRGGLSSALNELAAASNVGMEIDERAVPIHPEVAAACEVLGLDPLYVANEGKLVAIVAERDADVVLEAMRNHPRGRDARRIGRIVETPKMVTMRTALGTTRIVDMLAQDQLPRIC